MNDARAGSRRRSLFSVAAAATTILCAHPLYADQSGKPSQAGLDAITARGRLLAQYDRCAANSTDAVKATSPDNERVRRYIAVKDKVGWKVFFGRLNPQRTAFLVAYEAKPRDAELKAFDVKTNAVPTANTGFPFAAAKAMDQATSAFKGEKRPYNIAALPAPEGRIWVYVFPAQTSANVFPLGGDTRYLVSADGSKIISTRRMHKSVLEFATPPNGEKPVAGYHSAVLDNIPEDTDVAYVLGRRPSIAEYVLTSKFGYMIRPDGAISCLGTRAELEKKMKSH